ncbi:hypothetical protein [Actinoplanes sp. NPDC049118]|uniref:hypothetical protein n=1 Tax=Actinoplanes sp. NPDC049118 TaxID=3155769 RepID=UPI0033CD9595
MAVPAQTWWRPEVLGVFAWIFMAAAAGDAARTHRAHVAEVEERARRAEQTREEEAWPGFPSCSARCGRRVSGYATGSAERRTSCRRWPTWPATGSCRRR